MLWLVWARTSRSKVFAEVCREPPTTVYVFVGHFQYLQSHRKPGSIGAPGEVGRGDQAGVTVYFGLRLVEVSMSTSLVVFAVVVWQGLPC
jgi:hypothetical protein